MSNINEESILAVDVLMENVDVAASLQNFGVIGMDSRVGGLGEIGRAMENGVGEIGGALEIGLGKLGVVTREELGGGGGRGVIVERRSVWTGATGGIEMERGGARRTGSSAGRGMRLGLPTLKDSTSSCVQGTRASRP